MKSTLSKLGVLALVVASCGGEVDTAPQPTATTAAAAITTATAAATTAQTTQEILLTFDGEQCLYEGPLEAVLADPLTVTLINNSDGSVFGGVIWVPPDRLEEAAPLVGTDFPPSAEGRLTYSFYVEVSTGSQGSSSAVVAIPGTYVLECVSMEGATPVHVWWPAAIEISP